LRMDDNDLMITMKLLTIYFIFFTRIMMIRALILILKRKENDCNH